MKSRTAPHTSLRPIALLAWLTAVGCEHDPSHEVPSSDEHGAAKANVACDPGTPIVGSCKLGRVEASADGSAAEIVYTYKAPKCSYADANAHADSVLASWHRYLVNRPNDLAVINGQPHCAKSPSELAIGNETDDSNSYDAWVAWVSCSIPWAELAQNKRFDPRITTLDVLSQVIAP